MDNALSPIKDAFSKWCAYHKRWIAEWWAVVKTGWTRDLLLSLFGSAAGPLFALSRGWIKDHVGEMLVVSLLGYVLLLCGTWLWHALFTASRIYAQQETGKQNSLELSGKLLSELENNLALRKEIVSLRDELIGANQKLQASSDAYHEQYAEINRLQVELVKWPDVKIKDTDPQIYAEFCDDRGATPNKERQAYIGLINRGGSDALNVCIGAMVLKDTVIKFPCLAYLIAPGEAKYRYPDITTSDNRTPNHIDVFSHMAHEYITYHGLSAPELSIPLTVTYQDAEHNLYEARCELVFDPAAHSRVRMHGQNGSFAVLKTRNHNFKKIALAAK